MKAAGASGDALTKVLEIGRDDAYTLDELSRLVHDPFPSPVSIEVAGVVCPYFLAVYTSQDTSQRSRPFGHLQLVIDHGEFYYWLSFLGPQEIFDRFTPVFQHLLGSIQFIRE